MTNAQLQRQTSPQVQAFLNQPLIDYLWEMLAFLQDENERVTVFLTPHSMAMEGVQDIIFISKDLCWMEEKRVFGFQPVTGELEIEFHNGEGMMTLHPLASVA